MEISFGGVKNTKKKKGGGMANFINSNVKINVEGIEICLEKLNELEKKLNDVNSLIKEISSLSIDINFGEKQEDDLLNNQCQ